MKIHELVTSQNPARLRIALNEKGATVTNEHIDDALVPSPLVTADKFSADFAKVEIPQKRVRLLAWRERLVARASVTELAA